MERTIKIGTRSSPLALMQAEAVADLLKKQYRHLHVELVKMVSMGDRLVDRALADIGGKGLFAKELEIALLSDQIDVAVHSGKDLETRLPDGLTIAAMTSREDPRDVLISPAAGCVEDLPPDAHIGTASARRKAQLLRIRPDLNISLIRGNVGTRLARIANGDFDATVLSAAGLKRLGLLQGLQSEGIAHLIPLKSMPPAVAQGIVVLEVKKSSLEEPACRDLYQAVNHRQGWAEATLERQVLYELDGSCRSAISVYCSCKEDLYELEVHVYQVADNTCWSDRVSGKPDWENSLSRSLEEVSLMGKNLARRAASALVF